MSLKMSGHFTYKRLLRFVISPILMIICTAVYGVVDGFFISNYVGKVPFAAVNLVMPVDLVPVAIGFMIGEGGNALISKKLGENKRGIANQYFSLLIYTTAVIGVVLSLAGYAFTPVIADILGANDQLSLTAWSTAESFLQRSFSMCCRIFFRAFLSLPANLTSA